MMPFFLYLIFFVIKLVFPRVLVLFLVVVMIFVVSSILFWNYISCVEFNLDCFARGRDITLQNSGGPISGYDVKIELDFTQQAIIDGKMSSDCSDLLFKEAGGVDNIPYWVESGCNTPLMTIWMKLDFADSETKTIYMYYQCNVGQTTDVVQFDGDFFVFSNQQCTNYNGWRKEDRYNGKLVKLSQSGIIDSGYNHIHVIAGFSGSSSASDRIEGTWGTPCTFSHESHNHMMIFDTDPSTTLPAYKGVYLCLGEYLSITSGMMLPLTTTTLPSDFVMETSYDDLFPLAWTDLSEDGNNRHVHSFSATTYDGSSSRGGRKCDGNTWRVYKEHKHPISGTTSDANNVPSYLKVPIARFTGVLAPISTDLMIMADMVPPMGWEVRSDHDGYFLRGASAGPALEMVAMNLDHQHPPPFTISIVDSTHAQGKTEQTGSNWGSEWLCKKEHTHLVNDYGMGGGEIKHPYFDVMWIVRKDSSQVNVAIGGEETAAIECTGAQACQNGGICVGPSQCMCTEDWLPPTCEIPNCGVCINGDCDLIIPNQCNCQTGWTDSHLGCITPVCSTPCVNGDCVAPDVCECDWGFLLPYCETASCNPPCENGDCLSPNSCTCWEGFAGSLCTEATCQPNCYMGECTGPQNCTCSHGWDGVRCSIPLCEPDCQNGGLCILPDRCHCPIGWVGDRCEVPICDPECSSHGNCILPDTCECSPSSQWEGDLCEVPICDLPVCVNGNCSAPDTCECYDGWRSSDNGCLEPICTLECVRGECVAPDTCLCDSGWTGQLCEVEPVCSPPCEHGTCEYSSSSNENDNDDNDDDDSEGDDDLYCRCDTGWTGKKCHKRVASGASTNGGAIAAGIILPLLCVFCCLVVFITVSLIVFFYYRNKKFSTMENLKDVLFDTAEKEVELEEQKRKLDEAQLKDQKEKESLREELKKLKEAQAAAEVEKKLTVFNDTSFKNLGKESFKFKNVNVVYTASWAGKNVLLREIDPKSYSSLQINFTELFQAHVSELAGLKHPNINRVFGLLVPKLAIVTENFEHFSLGMVVNEAKLSAFSEKIRFLYEVMLGMSYYHRCGVVHGHMDENSIFVTEELKPKIDFGFGKVFKTNHNGNIFAAPEVIKGKYPSECTEDDEDMDEEEVEERDAKRDTFAFGMYLWIVMNRSMNPYGSKKTGQNFAVKVANDPTLRPVLSQTDFPNWLVNLVGQCLDHNPDMRPTSERVIMIIQVILEQEEDDEDGDDE